MGIGCKRNQRTCQSDTFKGNGTSRSGGDLVTQNNTVAVHELKNRISCKEEVLPARKARNPNCQGGCHNRYRGHCSEKTDKAAFEIQTTYSNAL